ncbi:MAG: hypothetical protein LBQ22_05635 [Bacteroidales bacterium]|jgi:hypothetical protein|nr:hypothetical protein [Bacteroidales bacterium]
MGIKVKTNIDFTKVKEAFLEKINGRVIKAFALSCKEAVNYAKENKGYTVQSGALSASTGFQLYQDGNLIEEYFETDPIGKEEGEKGLSTGKKVASASAAELDAPIVAVIVAGMPYAIYVESKGKDVLTGATLQLPSILSKNLETMFSGTGVSFEIQ